MLNRLPLEMIRSSRSRHGFGSLADASKFRLLKSTSILSILPLTLEAYSSMIFLLRIGINSLMMMMSNPVSWIWTQTRLRYVSYLWLSELIHSFAGNLSGVRARYAPSIRHAVSVRCEGFQESRQSSFAWPSSA
jgi:hypothetical protein